MNLRGNNPLGFEPNALTTRPSQLAMLGAAIFHICTKQTIIQKASESIEHYNSINATYSRLLDNFLSAIHRRLSLGQNLIRSLSPAFLNLTLSLQAFRSQITGFKRIAILQHTRVFNLLLPPFGTHR